MTQENFMKISRIWESGNSCAGKLRKFWDRRACQLSDSGFRKDKDLCSAVINVWKGVNKENIRMQEIFVNIQHFLHANISCFTVVGDMSHSGKKVETYIDRLVKDTSYVWCLTGHESLWLEWKAIYLMNNLSCYVSVHEPKKRHFQLILGSCIASILKWAFSISYIDKGKSQRNYVAFTYFRILGMDDKTYMIRLGFLRHVECIVHHTKI